MTASTLDCDIFVSITTAESQTVIDLRGAEEIQSAIQYILLGFVSYCLAFVSQMLDRPVEMLAWSLIASEWIKAYAIELAGVILWKGLLKRVIDQEKL